MVAKSPRSFPPQKCLPRPARIMTRTSSASSSGRRNACRSSSYIWMSTAFTGGRFIQTVTMPSAPSTSRYVNVIGVVSPSVRRADSTEDPDPSVDVDGASGDVGLGEVDDGPSDVALGVAVALQQRRVDGGRRHRRRRHRFAGERREGVDPDVVGTPLD